MTTSVTRELVETVREAAERLAERLRMREARPADLTACSSAVPLWWREGLAPAAVFGDGLLSLPAPGADTFSRPVTLLAASEISQIAGGEFVPVAWMDAGQAVALVHDVDDRPVVVASLDALRGVAAAGDAQITPVADSLAGFLDALMPQTVCQFTAGRERATIELIGEHSLLVERHGKVSRVVCDTDDEVGEVVASFVVDSLDAGMAVAFCPTRMRRVIAAHAGRGPAPAEKLRPEQRAALAIRRLLADDLLELVPTDSSTAPEEVLEDLIDEAGRFLERNQRARNLVRAFADWLVQHRAVEDLYADDDTVREALIALESELDPSVS